jgi:hypothetical protein
VLLRLAVASLLLAFATCKSSSRGKDGSPPDDSRPDDSRPLLADAASDSYMQGVYTCCAAGDGTNCCSGIRQGLCFRYGGIYGQCIGEGDVFDGKVVCAFCCPPLESRAAVAPPGDNPGASCQERRLLVSLLVCVRCGDGRCGPGENDCNCPLDCPPEDAGRADDGASIDGPD